MKTKEEVQKEINRLEKERNRVGHLPEMWHVLNARVWALKWVLKAGE